jgi:hypothetical protein
VAVAEIISLMQRTRNQAGNIPRSRTPALFAVPGVERHDIVVTLNSHLLPVMAGGTRRGNSAVYVGTFCGSEEEGCQAPFQGYAETGYRAKQDVRKTALCIDRARSIHKLIPVPRTRQKSPVRYCAERRRGPGAKLKAARECDMASIVEDKAGRGEPQGSRRPRQQAKRSRRVGFSLTGEEYALLEAAAGRAGRATAAYAAEAALTAAQGKSMEQDTLFHELLRELMRASGLVRRIGVNLNQAVAKLNATGQRSGDLVPYAAESFRRAEHLDAVAEKIRRALR